MDVVPGVLDWKEGFSLSVSNLELGNLPEKSEIFYLGLYVEDEDIPGESEECAELGYTLFSFISSCNFWDEDEEKWKAHGCEVNMPHYYKPQVVIKSTYFLLLCISRRVLL